MSRLDWCWNYRFPALFFRRTQFGQRNLVDLLLKFNLVGRRNIRSPEPQKTRSDIGPEERPWEKDFSMVPIPELSYTFEFRLNETRLGLQGWTGWYDFNNPNGIVRPPQHAGVAPIRIKRTERTRGKEKVIRHKQHSTEDVCGCAF